MNNGNSPRVRREIREEASGWFVELQENPRDEKLRRTFDQWLRRSPEHVKAFLEISAHWEEVAPNVAVESVEELVAIGKTDSRVVRLPLREQGVFSSSERGSVSGRHTRARWFAVAASVVTVAAVGLLWQHAFHGVYSTGFGEQHSLVLADGSTIELNSHSRIRVRYTKDERHIELLEGQALFHVARNGSRPFIVQSQDAQVRAIGTQFDVYHKETGTVVTVVEGRVAVIPVATASRPGVGVDMATSVTQPAAEIRAREHGDKPSQGSELFLDAGEQITVGAGRAANAAPSRLDPANIEAATAWTQHRLIFHGVALSDVVNEFNRYSERQMIITDPAIAAIQISGSFSSSDPTDLLRFLRVVGGYEVREAASSITISRKNLQPIPSDH
jgi:transmembrane sensor